jgi:hypothetical protein
MLVEIDECVLTATAARMLGIHRRELRDLILERPDLRPPLLDHSYYVWRPEDVERARRALKAARGDA